MAYAIDGANAMPALESMECTWNAPCDNPWEDEQDEEDDDGLFLESQ